MTTTGLEEEFDPKERCEAEDGGRGDEGDIEGLMATMDASLLMGPPRS